MTFEKGNDFKSFVHLNGFFSRFQPHQIQSKEREAKAKTWQKKGLKFTCEFFDSINWIVILHLLSSLLLLLLWFSLTTLDFFCCRALSWEKGSSLFALFFLLLFQRFICSRPFLTSFISSQCFQSAHRAKNCAQNLLNFYGFEVLFSNFFQDFGSVWSAYLFNSAKEKLAPFNNHFLFSLYFFFRFANRDK